MLMFLQGIATAAPTLHSVALSSKSIQNQSNKEPQQICLRLSCQRTMVGGGLCADWWGWLAKRSTVDLAKLWLNCRNPKLSTQQPLSLSLALSLSLFVSLSLFPILVMYLSISLVSPWWHFPLTEFYVDYRLRLQHFPLILTIMPLSIIYHAALWPPAPPQSFQRLFTSLCRPTLSPSIYLCIYFTHCQSVNLVEWVFGSIWIHIHLHILLVVTCIHTHTHSHIFISEYRQFLSGNDNGHTLLIIMSWQLGISCMDCRLCLYVKCLGLSNNVVNIFVLSAHYSW